MKQVMCCLLALVFAGVACWAGAQFNDWEAVRMYEVSPLTAYVLKLLCVSALVLASGICCGTLFKSDKRTRTVAVVCFVLLLLIQVGYLLLGTVSVSTILAKALVIVANMSLLTYLSAFLAGIAVGSKKE